MTVAKNIAMEVETNTGLMFRENIFGKGAQAEYEKNVQGFWNKLKEGWHDATRSMKKAIEAVEKELGVKVSDSEDFYTYANHIPSINKIKKEKLDNRFVKKFTNLLGNIYGIKFNGKKLDEKTVERYANAKHGIERNREMAVKNALTEVKDGKKVFNAEAYNQWILERDKVMAEKLSWEQQQKKLDDLAKTFGATIKDYSGITAIFDANGEKKYKDISEAAYRFVGEMEDSLGGYAKEFWTLINSMTDFALDEAYNSGLMSRNTYEQIKRMYKYYVPLRGFTEATAEDYFNYVETDHSPLNSVVKTAKGRKSEAENIFATILNMANSAIVQGSKNRLKQRLLNFALAHKTNLLSVDNLWYAKDENGEYVPLLPPSTDGMEPEAVLQVHADWEAEMKRREKEGTAVKHNPGLELGMRVADKKNAQQHAVIVKRNGREYVVWVNASPNLSNAINGVFHEDVPTGFGWLDTVNKFRAKMVTQYSPTFVFTNLSRDVQSATMVYTVRRGKRNGARFAKNVAKNLVKMGGLYARYRKDSLDTTKDLDRYFQEYLDNGGETGYTEMFSIEQYSKQLEKLTEKLNIKNATSRGMEAFGEMIDNANRIVENLCRFSAYMTSREAGLSIMQSITDAKEVSVNFNRKGSGAMGQRYIKSLFMFTNPAIQSVAQRIMLAKEYPAKMGVVFATEFAMGAAMPMLFVLLRAALFGEDEDELWGNYYNLSDFRRRSSINIPGLEGVAHIPLSHESRVFYGVGELMTSVIMGHEEYDSIGEQFFDIALQSLPINPVDGWVPGENIWESLAYNITPDALKFVTEAVQNRDFAGNTIHNRTELNEYAPEYMRGKKGTAAIYQWLSKLLSTDSGYDKSVIGKTLGFLVNPSVMEHGLKSYFGGAYTFAEKMSKTIAWALGDEEMAEFRNIPIASSFYTPLEKYEAKPSEERTRRDWEDAFKFFKDEMKSKMDEETSVNTAIKNGDEYAEPYLEKMKNDGTLLAIDVYKDAYSKIKDLYAASDIARKAKDFDKVDSIDQEIYAAKRFLVDRMEQLAENPMIGYTFTVDGKDQSAYGVRETYGDLDDEKSISETLEQLKKVYDEWKEIEGTRAGSSYLSSREKELRLYLELKDVNKRIRGLKDTMDKAPGRADEYMESIREERAKALRLIEGYE